MELHEANRILRSVKAALYADGVKLPPAAETDGLMMLLGKTDTEKFLAPKIRHARTLPPASTGFARSSGYIAFFRALGAMQGELSDPVTTLSAMLLNKTLFGDLDSEAGKPRSREATTAGSAHTDHRYIPGSLKSIVTKMNDIQSAPTIGKEDFAGYLTHYMRELIILHPFERGSEFTVRIFIMLFCKLKGFSLCYYRSPPGMIRAAEDDAFASDDISPLYKILLNCLSYEHVTISPQKPTPPRTKREIGRQSRAAAVSCEQPAKELDSAKPKEEAPPADNDEVLRRAVKLQQKISKLNEQLTELMSQQSNKQEDKP